MRALLAAALGMPLRPFTIETPKCLVEIGGQPLLDYWLDLLFRGGVAEIPVNLHHHPAAVNDYRLTDDANRFIR